MSDDQEALMPDHLHLGSAKFSITPSGERDMTVHPTDLYIRIEVERVGSRRWRLTPVARNGARFPEFRTYVTRWNAKRAARRRYPGVYFTERTHP